MYFTLKFRCILNLNPIFVYYINFSCRNQVPAKLGYFLIFITIIFQLKMTITNIFKRRYKERNPYGIRYKQIYLQQ